MIKTISNKIKTGFNELFISSLNNTNDMITLKEMFKYNFLRELQVKKEQEKYLSYKIKVLPIHLFELFKQEKYIRKITSLSGHILLLNNKEKILYINGGY